MNRSIRLLVIALGLVGYGIYRGLYVPAMLIGPSVPLLLIGFLLQAVFGIAAGLGVGLGAPWSPLVIILLGVSAAATVLVEAFVLGIVAYLRALLEAGAAIIVAVLLAACVKDRRGAIDNPPVDKRDLGPAGGAPGSRPSRAIRAYPARMTKLAAVMMGVLVAFAAGTVGAVKAPKPITVRVNLIDTKGIGKPAGTVTIKEAAEGLELDTNLKGLPPGEHGFHLHENGSCAPADKEGTPTAGQAAGGHYDPEGTNAHKGPGGSGHKGDLPKLEVDPKGNANAKLKGPGLKLADVRGKALVIHEGGDNYSDTPKLLGGGGTRIACGVVPAPAAAAKKKTAK